MNYRHVAVTWPNRKSFTIIYFQPNIMIVIVYDYIVIIEMPHQCLRHFAVYCRI